MELSCNRFNMKVIRVIAHRMRPYAWSSNKDVENGIGLSGCENMNVWKEWNLCESFIIFLFELLKKID